MFGNRKRVSNFSTPLPGMVETLWRPKMNPEELFECISQSLLSALDRDAASGWGVIVHVVEPDKVTFITKIQIGVW